MNGSLWNSPRWIEVAGDVIDASWKQTAGEIGRVILARGGEIWKLQA